MRKIYNFWLYSQQEEQGEKQLKSNIVVAPILINYIAATQAIYRTDNIYKVYHIKKVK